MALKRIKYLCFGCRTTHTVRIPENEPPRRTMRRSCPNCGKYRQVHIAGYRPITRRDAV
jgi:hypothetical protein